MDTDRAVRRCGAALAAAAVVLGSGSVGAAQGPGRWSAPVTVSSSATFLGQPFIGFGRSGRALVAWSYQDGIGEDARTVSLAAPRGREGRLGPARRVPALAAPPVVYGRDRVAIVSAKHFQAARRGHARITDRVRMRVALGSTSARFGTLHRIATIVPVAQPALAANDRGHIALAYGERLRGRTRVATLVERRPGGAFGAPRVLAGSVGAMGVAVAVGPRGDLVVAWKRRGWVEGRVRPAGGRLGPVVRLAASDRLPDVLRAAVSARGAVWVAWAATRETEVGFDSPYRVRLAMRPAGAREFRPARRLAGNARLAGLAGMDLAVDPAGNGFVAWSGWDGAHLRARLATLTPGGAVVGTRTLSEHGYDASVQRLATSRESGQVLACWERLNDVRELGTQVLAGLVEPGGAYAGEEIVSGDRATAPAAAFDPVSGTPTIVWTQQSGPGDHVLRAATRGPAP